jgi:hypothetical protein
LPQIKVGKGTITITGTKIVFPDATEQTTAGIGKLSELEIDVNKDWASKVIYNAYLVPRIYNYMDDDADLKLGDVVLPPPPEKIVKILTVAETTSLIQPVDWELYSDGGYLAIRYPTGGVGAPYSGHGTDATYLDRSFRCRVYHSGGYWQGLQGRFQDLNNIYLNGISTDAATTDHSIWKVIAGTYTQLAWESVDLTAGWYDLVFEISGSALRSSRDGGTTYPVSVTDTDITTAGRWAFWVGKSEYIGRPISFTAPSTPRPKPIAYFEVPIIGAGSENDPFRAQMPDELVDDPELGKINRLALSISSLIKTDRATGKPLEYVAIVRVFDQPDRNPKLRDIPTSINALRAIPGVIELDKSKAKSRAKEIDDLLTDEDLKEW